MRLVGFSFFLAATMYSVPCASQEDATWKSFLQDMAAQRLVMESFDGAPPIASLVGTAIIEKKLEEKISSDFHTYQEQAQQQAEWRGDVGVLVKYSVQKSLNGGGAISQIDQQFIGVDRSPVSALAAAMSRSGQANDSGERVYVWITPNNRFFGLWKGAKSGVLRGELQQYLERRAVQRASDEAFMKSQVEAEKERSLTFALEHASERAKARERKYELEQMAAELRGINEKRAKVVSDLQEAESRVNTGARLASALKMAAGAISFGVALNNAAEVWGDDQALAKIKEGGDKNVLAKFVDERVTEDKDKVVRSRTEIEIFDKRVDDISQEARKEIREQTGKDVPLQ
jgi:hypothetical protein